MARVVWEKVTHWWRTPAQELAPGKTRNALLLSRGTKSSTRRRGSAAWTRQDWGQHEDKDAGWSGGAEIWPQALSCVLLPLFYSLMILLTRRKREMLLHLFLEFVALTSAMFMQERNVWARQVKHLLAGIEWDNTDHAHGCQGGTTTSEWNCEIFLDIP